MNVIDWFKTNIKEDIQNIKNLPVAAWLAPLAPVAASVPIVASTSVAAVKALPSIATKAFKALPFTGKLAVAGTAPLLVTSQKVRETAVQAPTKLPGLYKDLGSFIDNPTVEKGVALVKEHPVAAGAAVVGTGYTVGKVLPIGAAYFLSNVGKKKSGSSDIRTMVEPMVSKVDLEELGKSKAEIKADKKVALESLESQEDLFKMQSKASLELLEAQTKAQLQIMEAQTKQAKELSSLTPSTAATSITPNSPAAVVATTPKKRKKRKKKATKKKTKKKAKKKKSTKKYKKTKRKKKRR
jgi:hypothetical protein